MPDHEDRVEALDLRFRRPDSQVVSVRLSREESHELTEAARRAGEPLSTFIRGAALEVARRRAQQRVLSRLGGPPSARVLMITSGAQPVRDVAGPRAGGVSFTASIVMTGAPAST